jgi:hypothetical protein
MMVPQAKRAIKAMTMVSQKRQDPVSSHDCGLKSPSKNAKAWIHPNATLIPIQAAVEG